MKGKKNSKNSKINLRIIISYILLILCIAIMIYSGIKIFNWLSENKQSEEIIKKVSNSVTIDDKIDNVNKYNVDFTDLKQSNSDTVAWFKLNGTNIEYPVVKTSNNDYYMTHSFDKSYNSAGWIFMDYINKFDGTDDNIVIFGHNRKDGSMFGTLKNILTEDWLNNEDNFTIPFITENEKSEYKVFSVYKVEVEDYYITTNFANSNEFQKFLDTIKSRSIKDFGVEVTTENHVLTLSTCADNDKYRVVLHAVKIK